MDINKTTPELIRCPLCGSIDILTEDELVDIFYYKETDAFKYDSATDTYRYIEKEYRGQKPIGIDILYQCKHCNTYFEFIGKLTDTKIEMV